MTQDSTAILDLLRGGLIVSCQANEIDVLHGTAMMTAMAQAVEVGGAAGLRINSAEHVVAHPDYRH
jgi:N-acylglucosamine-6-phosphate 2-epimerase